MSEAQINADILNAKILLVDDRKENLHALESLLGDKNVEVFKANSGREALELLLVHDFALALLDVQMPEINGFELAELMRGSEQSKTVPIIFVTAGAIDQKHTFRGYEAGAVDFLYKPLDPRIVKGKVQVFLELDRQKKTLNHQLKVITCATEQLKIAKENAEAASRSKSAFLANMSHEIRTPLGAILGFTELLKDPNVSETEKEKYLGIISKSGNALSHLIDDILDLAKVEAGKLATEMTSFSLREVLGDVVSLLNVRAKEKNLGLELSYLGEIPEIIESDPLRLRQILLNIVGNAIKFTSEGGVKISVSCLQIERSEKFRLIFEVKDTGVGISEDRRKVLFQSFSQADNSTTRKFGGTGLGLILSRRLAALLGGNVHLAPQGQEQGSIFVIELEIPHAEFLKQKSSKKILPKKDSASEINLKKVRVLVVEDSADNQVLINLFLSKKGASTDFANNGQEGIEKALDGNFDVVLMDIQMPIMDGHEATKELRSRGYKKPIIALSAHAMSEERAKSIEVGCNEHLVKPINRQKLIETVAKFAGDSNE